jgi:hypothetical protein
MNPSSLCFSNISATTLTPLVIGSMKFVDDRMEGGRADPFSTIWVGVLSS